MDDGLGEVFDLVAIRAEHDDRMIDAARAVLDGFERAVAELGEPTEDDAPAMFEASASLLRAPIERGDAAGVRRALAAIGLMMKGYAAEHGKGL